MNAPLWVRCSGILHSLRSRTQRKFFSFSGLLLTIPRNNLNYINAFSPINELFPALDK